MRLLLSATPTTTPLLALGRWFLTRLIPIPQSARQRFCSTPAVHRTDALLYNYSGGANNGVGAYALFHNTTGNANEAMGFNALGNNDSGSENIAIGDEALISNVRGSSNTVVGSQAGANIQLGS